MGRAPITHSMYGRRQVGYLHLDIYHMHGSSHEGMVFSIALSLQ